MSTKHYEAVGAALYEQLAVVIRPRMSCAPADRSEAEDIDVLKRRLINPSDAAVLFVVKETVPEAVLATLVARPNNANPRTVTVQVRFWTGGESTAFDYERPYSSTGREEKVKVITDAIEKQHPERLFFGNGINFKSPGETNMYKEICSAVYNSLVEIGENVKLVAADPVETMPLSIANIVTAMTMKAYAGVIADAIKPLGVELDPSVPIATALYRTDHILESEFTLIFGGWRIKLRVVIAQPKLVDFTTQHFNTDIPYKLKTALKAAGYDADITIMSVEQLQVYKSGCGKGLARPLSSATESEQSLVDTITAEIKGSNGKIVSVNVIGCFYEVIVSDELQYYTLIVEAPETADGVMREAHLFTPAEQPETAEDLAATLDALFQKEAARVTNVIKDSTGYDVRVVVGLVDNFTGVDGDFAKETKAPLGMCEYECQEQIDNTLKALGLYSPDTMLSIVCCRFAKDTTEVYITYCEHGVTYIVSFGVKQTVTVVPSKAPSITQ